MTTIYLIRHAESAPDLHLPEPFWPLSPVGRRQAKDLVPLLRDLSPTHIYSSPYPRAIDTVRAFADTANLPIALDHDVRERRLTATHHPDWLALVERAWTDFDFRLPECESSREAQTRMRLAIERIMERHIGETTLVASHGNAIGLLLNALDPAFGFRQWKTLRNPDVICLKAPAGKLEWDRSYKFAAAPGELRTHVFDDQDDALRPGKGPQSADRHVHHSLIAPTAARGIKGQFPDRVGGAGEAQQMGRNHESESHGNGIE